MALHAPADRYRSLRSLQSSPVGSGLGLYNGSGSGFTFLITELQFFFSFVRQLKVKSDT